MAGESASMEKAPAKELAQKGFDSGDCHGTIWRRGVEEYLWRNSRRGQFSSRDGYVMNSWADGLILLGVPPPERHSQANKTPLPTYWENPHGAYNNAQQLPASILGSLFSPALG